MSCGSDHCITCGDDGTPMRVLRISDDLALCEDESGNNHNVELALDDAGAGDQVLVHAGTALTRLA